MAHNLIFTTDSRMKRILEMAESVANSKAAVLISGESGTGKELLARFIHTKSFRSSGCFVAINCAAVPEGLLESELFGHEKGAFTGAYASKPGKFEQAHEGTLLLDELSEMPLLLQAKLLRAIQEGEFQRVGSNKTIKVNVRIIATTNRSLESMVKLGSFREDLYFRLNVIPLHIPSLRERRGDLENLAQHFLETSCDSNGKQLKSFSSDAMAKLSAHSWPGNVRELENVVERAVLLSKSDIITSADLPFEVEVAAPTLGPGLTVSEAEKLLILNTLEYTRNNKTQAARLLGISVRTLRNKLHEYRGENV